MTKKAFTLAEAIIVAVILGLMALLCISGLNVFNPAQKGNEVQASKTLENFDQVFNLIFANHSESFNLTDLNDKNGSFSITDDDVTARFAAFFKEYLNIIDYSEQTSLSDSYFSNNILDYNNSSVGIKLKDAYSSFMFSQNGIIYGFRLYKTCFADELNSFAPLAKERKTINNICGSIFYDVNGFKGPNKLGSDQYIIPFDEQGSKFKR